MRPAPSYDERHRRAAQLRSERPHTAQMLELYAHVLGRQEAVYREAVAMRAATGPDHQHGGDGGPACLEALPWPTLAAGFRRFATAVAQAAPGPAREGGERLAGAADEPLTEALERVVRRQDLAALAGELAIGAAHVAFFGRAYVQPWAEALAAARWRESADGPADGTTLCPGCGWPAQVGVLFDEGSARGCRALVCGLCGHGWSFPRQRCAQCGEEDPERLTVHELPELPHLRVEECASCRRYLKTVDLRRLGRAVPVVEDLGSPEIDLWAAERDLQKVCPNLLAL